MELHAIASKDIMPHNNLYNNLVANLISGLGEIIKWALKQLPECESRMSTRPNCRLQAQPLSDRSSSSALHPFSPARNASSGWRTRPWALKIDTIYFMIYGGQMLAKWMTRGICFYLQKQGMKAISSYNTPCKTSHPFTIKLKFK